MRFKKQLLLLGLFLLSLPALSLAYDSNVFDEESEIESLPYEQELVPLESEEQEYEIEREEFPQSEENQERWIDHGEEAPSFEAY